MHTEIVPLWRRGRRGAALKSCVASGLLGAVTAAGAKSKFATFDGPASAFTVGQGISDSGATTGIYADENGAFHGFLRSAEFFDRQFFVPPPDVGGRVAVPVLPALP